ncbi:MAG: DUF4132 domain-containing protein, partial [Firmicutes bacterium]|nr:DUF4132 domain-containing protein [Bacillota bacterium]
ANKLIARIMETLAFSEYRGNESVRIFTVKDGTAVDMRGARIDVRDFEIMILHPVDTDNARGIANHFPIQAFPQFDREVYRLNDQEYYQNAVIRFKGSLIDGALMAAEAQKLGWKRETRADGRTCLIKISCGIIAEFLTSPAKGDLVAMGEIRFYDCEKTPRTLKKYILSGANNIHVDALQPRYVSEIINEAYKIVCQ